MKSRLKIAILSLLISSLTFGQKALEIPDLSSRVTDLTGLLNQDQKSSLSDQLKALEDRKGSQVAVLIVDSTEPETMEQFSIRVVDEWKLGREDVDDGVLLLVAKADRNLRIEVGYGLEGAITDAYSKRIINNIIVPHFRDGDYYLGIEEGVEAIIGLIDGEELPELTSTRKTSSNDNSFGLFIGIVILIFVVFILKALFTKSLGNMKSNLIMMPGIFMLSWIFTSLTTAIFISVFSFIFMNNGGGGRGGRRGGGYYGGYSGGGWSSGGGGFSGGGFSGGGGGFGGGGASGSW